MTSTSTAPVAPAVSQPKLAAEPRLGYVQGLRAIAVILVVIFHAGLPVRGGFIGVDVFFVISGFVITGVLLRDLETYGRLRMWRFYQRRVRRLLPALSVMLVVTAVASALIQSPLGSEEDTAKSGILASVWLANFGLYVLTGDYFADASDTFPLLHTWSLAVEEQFYLVFPILILLAFIYSQRVKQRSTLWIAGAVALVSIVSLILDLVFSYLPIDLPFVTHPASAAFYMAPTRAWEFGAGAIVSLLWHNRTFAMRPRAGGALAGVGLIILIASAVLIPSDAIYPGWPALLPVASSVAIILGCILGASQVRRILEFAPARWCGDVSYGWYLWHWPCIVFAAALLPHSLAASTVAAFLSLALAWLSFRFLESPIRSRGRSSSTRADLRLVAVCVVTPLVAFSTLYVGASRSWGLTSVQRMAAQVVPVPVGYRIGCHSSIPINDRNLAPCEFNLNTNGQPILLVGDSNAGQYAEAVIGAGRRLGRPVTIATMSGCSFLDVTILSRGVDSRPCRTYVVDSTAWIQRQSPRTVVIASSGEAVTDPSQSIKAPDGQEARSPAEKGRLWREGLERTIRRLQSAGDRVVLIQTMPHFGTSSGWWSPAECPMPLLRQGVGKCGRAELLAASDASQQLVLGAEKQAAANTGAHLMHIREVICPNGLCRTNIGDTWIYRDGLHITTRFSSSLSARFADELRHR